MESGLTRRLAYVTRATIFVGVGALCGAMASRVRKAGEESERYFEMSSQMLGIFELDGRPVRLNRRWTEVLGLAAGRAAWPCRWRDVVHPDDLPVSRRRDLAELIERLRRGRGLAHRADAHRRRRLSGT